MNGPHKRKRRPVAFSVEDRLHCFFMMRHYTQGQPCVPGSRVWIGSGHLSAAEWNHSLKGQAAATFAELGRSYSEPFGSEQTARRPNETWVMYLTLVSSIYECMRNAYCMSSENSAPLVTD